MGERFTRQEQVLLRERQAQSGSLSDSVTMEVRGSHRPWGLLRRRLPSFPGSHHPGRPAPHPPHPTPPHPQLLCSPRCRAVPLWLAWDPEDLG